MKYQLPREFATKWVAALREFPEQKHHKGELQNAKDRSCYCAIGVSCLANNIDISDNGMSMIVDGEKVDYYEKFIFKDRLAYEIVNLNDRQELTFNEIADWIEANVEFV